MSGKESDSKDDRNVDESKPRRPARERKDTTQDKSYNNITEETIQETEGQKPRRARRGSKENNEGLSNAWMTVSDPKDVIKEEEDVEIAPVAANKDKHFQEDEILLIPDLDEDGTDNDQRIAHAPRNVSRKIPTLVELENEVNASVPSSVDSGYDLGVLLSSIVPRSLVLEDDGTWTFESLLRDVTDELTAPIKAVLPTKVEVNSSTAVKSNTTKAIAHSKNDKKK